MTRDEILDVFDRVFGAGKYPRGLAIMAGEELVGAGRREASNALFKGGIFSGMRYEGQTLNARVHGNSIRGVVLQMAKLDQSGDICVALLEMPSRRPLWERSSVNPNQSLMELYLLAGVKPK